MRRKPSLGLNAYVFSCVVVEFQNCNIAFSGSLAMFAAVRRASLLGRAISLLVSRTQWLFFGFRVRIQPQTTSAVIAVTKIPRYNCCIVVFSVA
jgi:hypothetical protein